MDTYNLRRETESCHVLKELKWSPCIKKTIVKSNCFIMFLKLSRMLRCLVWISIFNLPVFLLWKYDMSIRMWYHSIQPVCYTEEVLTYLEAGVSLGPGEEKFLSMIPLHHSVSTLSQTSLSELQRLLDDLSDVMTKPKVACRKRVRQGGNMCRKISDGDKVICLDPLVAPTTSKPCLVYSFGVGNDFSFDREMGELGCQVYAFDDDPNHDSMFRDPEPRVNFLHLRLSPGRKIEVKSVFHRNHKVTHKYLYRPLDNIMYILHQYNATIDVLKIDVDGSEWEVFENSLFQTPILERTRQLAVEVHLDIFLNTTQFDYIKYTVAIQNYTRVFRGLEERGLLLANYEPNLVKPEIAEVAGRIFPLYAEQLWLNFRGRNSSIPSLPSESDFDLVESY